MTDSRLLLTLLAALVPAALFFSLLRGRKKEAPPPEEAGEKPQAEDYGLARETSEPQAEAETAHAADGAAAAAAGGALIVGYEVAKSRQRAAEAEPDRDKPS